MAAKETKTESMATEKPTTGRDVEEGRGAGDHARDDRRARLPHFPIRRRWDPRGELAPSRGGAAGGPVAARGRRGDASLNGLFADEGVATGASISG
jgi:hypothetical protein